MSDFPSLPNLPNLSGFTVPTSPAPVAQTAAEASEDRDALIAEAVERLRQGEDPFVLAMEAGFDVSIIGEAIATIDFESPDPQFAGHGTLGTIPAAGQWYARLMTENSRSATYWYLNRAGVSQGDRPLSGLDAPRSPIPAAGTPTGGASGGAGGEVPGPEVVPTEDGGFEYVGPGIDYYGGPRTSNLAYRYRAPDGTPLPAPPTPAAPTASPSTPSAPVPGGGNIPAGSTPVAPPQVTGTGGRRDGYGWGPPATPANATVAAAPTPAPSSPETPDQRIARIVADLVAGRRTLDDVRRSVNALAGRPADEGISGAAGVNDAALLAAARNGDTTTLANRIRQVFTNRNVALTYYGNGVAPPPAQTPTAPTTPTTPTTSGQEPKPGAPTTPAAPAAPGAPAPTTPTTPTAPAAPATDPYDAMGYIQGVLDSYGLGSLADWAMQQLQQGYSSDRILLDLRNTREFRDRFPALFDRQEQGLPPISPAEYVAYEQQARQVFRQFGLPEQFLDEASDFGRLIAEDVSVAELYERVQSGFQRVANSPAEVRAAFGDFFGARGDAALAAFFLDPDRAAPMLRNMVTDAEIAGAGRQYQIGTDFDTSRRIRELGYTGDTARQTFEQIRQLDPLFAETVGEGANFDDLAAEREGVQAGFGLDPAQRRRIERRQRERVAAFQGGGGAAASQRGFIGLGADRRGDY